MPSPDGKQVAYTWEHEGPYELRVVGLDGTEPRVLYSNAGASWVQPTDWSPDGKSILTVVDRKDRTTQMVLVSVGDGSVRALKTFDARVPQAIWEARAPQRPRFSPDGRYIAYASPQRSESAEKDIFVLALDGGRETPLVQHPANESFLDWTPDGKGILFSSDRTGTVGVWWMQVAEGKPQGTPELLKPGLGFTPMGFTRNGAYYYGVGTEMNDVYIAELDLATGKLISAPSLATQRLVGSNSSPDWSPDGRELIFLSKRGPGAWGARALCVRSTETGAVRELASKIDRVHHVRWTPDGRSLLGVAEYPAGNYDRVRIDVQTGDFSPFPLNRGAIGGWPPAWSRDGKAIFYHRGRFIVVRDLETGQEKELHSLADNSSSYTGGLALSRDGRQLAFVSLESGSKIIRVMPAAGGAARELLRGDQSLMRTTLTPVAWAADGLSVLFARRTSSTGTDLWLVPVQGGEARKLDLAAENIRDLSVHPDGRHIAFTAGGDRSEVWVMENFLPVAGNREQGRRP
jgi:Tol biopolymer transport system component